METFAENATRYWEVIWVPLVWLLLLLGGTIGLLAVASPRVFEAVATRSKTWIDTNRFVALLEKSVDIDHYFIRHSRILGSALLTSTAVLAYVYLTR